MNRKATRVPAVTPIAAAVAEIGAPAPYSVKVRRLHPDAVLPVYGSTGAACFDLHAVIDRDRSLTHHERREVEVPGRTQQVLRTGLAFEVPAGFVMLVYSRSGHGFKDGVRLSNCVGVIDSDYRGEVRVALQNDSRRDFVVKHGDRVAQAMLAPVMSITFDEVTELSDTARGANGYGSTGR